MNPQLAKLVRIAEKKERIIIGLMSGTSMDGLDIAVCSFNGAGMDVIIKLLEFETITYMAAFKKEVKTIFSRHDADLERVCLLNPWIALQHAGMILDFLKRKSIAIDTIDIIASHGQTIYHSPASQHSYNEFGNATLQIGDGDHLAHKTGIITISDFRQKHIAAGGEGAPLAAYGDFLIFSRRDENRIMLNIGGIANFTYLPGTLNADEVYCTDTGTGNTLMDAYVQANFPGKYFDENSIIALQGNVNEELLRKLEDHIFFKMPFPKTTGPELFNLSYLAAAQQSTFTSGLSHGDVMATLNRFSADTIVSGLKSCMKPGEEYKIYTSGGGMHNPLLMKNIKTMLPPVRFYSTDVLAIKPDAKEAVLFAVLANECICGGNVNFGTGRNGIPNVSMGKISFPN